jgi:uncharacterized protein YebE (UPF0316 family)
MTPETLALLAASAGIFALRILDVSIGTLRIAYLVRGRRLIAGGLSFFESFVWLTAAAQVITSLDSPWKFVAYAGGYAAGTVLGVSIERWIAAGDTLLRVVTPTGSPSIEGPLREAGFYVTSLNGQGRDGDVRVLFTVLARRKVPDALRIVRAISPNAYVTLEATTPARASLVGASVVRK